MNKPKIVSFSNYTCVINKTKCMQNICLYIMYCVDELVMLKSKKIMFCSMLFLVKALIVTA